MIEARADQNNGHEQQSQGDTCPYVRDSLIGSVFDVEPTMNVRRQDLGDSTQSFHGQL